MSLGVIDARSMNVSQLVLSSEANLTSPTAQLFRLASSSPVDVDGELVRGISFPGSSRDWEAFSNAKPATGKPWPSVKAPLGK